MNQRSLLIILGVGVVLAMLGADPQTLVVFAAASLTDAFTEIGAA